MSPPDSDLERRLFLQLAAASAIPSAVLTSTVAAAQAPAPSSAVTDFDFLAGEWRIKNRRLKKAGTNDWDEFDGEATVHRLLNGVVSIEELRIPQRDFSGMGLRAYDFEKKLWADHWLNSKAGVVNPPMMGSFVGGVGSFIADETQDDKPIKARGVWDRITATSCRWHQATSTDDGKSWVENWTMDWQRV